VSVQQSYAPLDMTELAWADALETTMNDRGKRRVGIPAGTRPADPLMDPGPGRKHLESWPGLPEPPAGAPKPAPGGR
jgi:hypothetical protein